MTVELLSRHIVRTVDSIGLPGDSNPVDGRASREDAYTIHVTTSLADTAERLIELIGGAKVAIITDTTVMDLYGPTLVRALHRAGMEPEIAAIPPGEQHKTLAQACRLLDWLTGTKIGRRDIVVALGGGVVIDMGGWVASVYMRGVPYINVPTTLIGQVDAGIGGFRAEGAEVIGVDVVPGRADLTVDVTDPVQVAEAVSSIGELDVCVANAGVSLMEPFTEGSPDSWGPVLEVNLLGVMTTFRAAVAAMPAGGRLLATASTAGLRGEALASAYCASKAGVISIVRTLSIELAPCGINVNAVAPGQIDTEMNRGDLDLVARRTGRPAADLLQEQLERDVPARRLGDPEDVAAAFAFLAGPDAAYVTGAVLRVDGGLLSG